MLGGKQVAAVFGGKLPPVVEGEPKRGRMGLEQDVGHRDLVLEVGAFSFVARIFVAADIVPRPAIEGAFTNPCDVVRWNVIADRVALVGRAPQVAIGADRKPYAVANTRGVNPAVAAVGVERQHGGAISFVAPRGAERMLRRPCGELCRIKLSHPFTS